jgi:anti-anti-sigma factor
MRHEPVDEDPHDPRRLPTLSFEIDDRADRVRIVLSGHLVEATAARFTLAIDECLQIGTNVEIDLANVRFIDTPGLLVLVDAWIARSDDQNVIVSEASPQVRRLFERTAVASVLGLRPQRGDSTRPV